MLTITKVNGRRVLTPVQRESIPQPKSAKKRRHDALMDALRALAEMAEENPPTIKNHAWQKASEGIATILKKGLK